MSGTEKGKDTKKRRKIREMELKIHKKIKRINKTKM
jgi:hypothetical protein